MPGPELPHFEEAELETEVQRKFPMGCWEVSQSKIVIQGLSGPNH